MKKIKQEKFLFTPIPTGTVIREWDLIFDGKTGILTSYAQTLHRRKRSRVPRNKQGDFFILGDPFRN